MNFSLTKRQKLVSAYIAIILLSFIGGFMSGLSLEAIVSLLVFITSIYLIATESLSRSASALLGALLIFIFFLVDAKFNPAYSNFTPEIFLHYVDLNTILVLFGILVVAHFGLRSGLFYYMGVKVAKLSRGDPIKLYFILAIFTYFLGIFLISIATIVIVVSLTIAISKTLKIDPRPYVIMEIFTINAGSPAIMISSVPNIIIAEYVGLSFMFFVVNLLPFTLFFFFISLWILYSSSKPSPEIDIRRTMAILEIDEWLFVTNPKEFYLSGISILGLIIGFMVSKELMVISLIFAVISLAFYSKPHDLLKDVDWDTLLFFTGFYIVVATLNITGVLSSIAKGLVGISGGNILMLLVLLFWISVIISGFVDNIPYVLVLIPIVNDILANPQYSGLSAVFWIILILACNIGGALTPYSAPQNLLAISLAKRAEYDIPTKLYYRISIKWTFLGGAIAFIYGIMFIYAPILITEFGLLGFISLVTLIIFVVVLLIVYRLVGFAHLASAIREIIYQISRYSGLVKKRVKKIRKTKKQQS